MPFDIDLGFRAGKNKGNAEKNDNDRPAKVRTYQPGTCNIGAHNRLFRFAYGFLFMTLSIELWAGFSAAGFGVLPKLFLIIPLYVGFLGLYQALFGFCVYHAKKRTYDMR